MDVVDSRMGKRRGLDFIREADIDLRQDLLQLLEDSACLGLGARAYCPEM